MCAYIHTWQIHKGKHIYRYIRHLHYWVDYYYYFPDIRIVQVPFNGNEQEQRAAFKLIKRA